MIRTVLLLVSVLAALLVLAPVGNASAAEGQKLYQQSHPLLTLTGTWSTVSTYRASAGSYAQTNRSASAVIVAFTGQSLDWIATIGPNMASADVIVDNRKAVKVSLYSATTAYKQKVWSTGTLAQGTHRVEIRWRTGNPAGKYISVDRLDVLGYVPSPTRLSASEFKWAEQRLTDLSYRPGTVDGVRDSRTRGAVIAFQKWEGLTRDGAISAEVWKKLLLATRPRPKHDGSSPWIEVDKPRQVLLYCKDGAVVTTLHVSTGSASVGIVSPSGTWTILRKSTEARTYNYLPCFYTGRPYNLAIHGYTSVPIYPASHGCVRTQPWDQPYLYPLITVGMYVYIY